MSDDSTVSEQVEEIHQAVDGFCVSPDRLRWLYIQAAITAFEGNVSRTARCLGMHRRTLQRVLQAGDPGRRRA